MKKLFILLILCFTTLGNAQIGYPMHYPTLKPFHILDEKLEDISFALSFRILESDYNGPLVRLRRASDNAEQDFCASDNDIVDIALINSWRSGANVYVVKWYDQSGLGRDATQSTASRQPQFTPNAAQPFFKGDGGDFLTITNGNLQNVTNNGLEGTVFTLANATNRQQYSFGVTAGFDRWSSHLNWSNGLAYFDAGKGTTSCCNAIRSFTNTPNTWNYLTFIRKTSAVTANKNGVQVFNGANLLSRSTLTSNFGILHANGDTKYSTTSYTEFIMYKKEVSSDAIEEIENNAITFWNL